MFVVVFIFYDLVKQLNVNVVLNEQNASARKITQLTDL
jgi:hypothetical protein